MRKQASAYVLLFTVLLVGCGLHYPQTAEEFRQEVPKSASTKTETFEVNRSFRDVAETFKKKAPECLDVTVRNVSWAGNVRQVTTVAYKPTVVVTKERAELHVQMDLLGAANAAKQPEGGFYLLVADAYLIDKNRTRIQTYGPARYYEVLSRAITGWASGENLGCPDMTKAGS